MDHSLLSIRQPRLQKRGAMMITIGFFLVRLRRERIFNRKIGDGSSTPGGPGAA
jgi:hypothetical protein